MFSGRFSSDFEIFHSVEEIEYLNFLSGSEEPHFFILDAERRLHEEFQDDPGEARSTFEIAEGLGDEIEKVTVSTHEKYFIVRVTHSVYRRELPLVACGDVYHVTLETREGFRSRSIGCQTKRLYLPGYERSGKPLEEIARVRFELEYRFWRSNADQEFGGLMLEPEDGKPIVLRAPELAGEGVRESEAAIFSGE